VGRALKLGAAAVVALGILGNCADDDRDVDAAASAAPSTSVAAPTAVAAPRTEPSPERAATEPSATATPSPPPLNLVPITYVGEVADKPAVPPLPALPGAGSVGATLEVRGGWTGSFTVDGSDPRVGVRCTPGPLPDASIEVYSLNYAAITDADATEYSLPDGGWSLRVSRLAALDNPAGPKVSVTATDADGMPWEIAGFGTEAEPDIVAAGPDDNSAVAFAFVGVITPRWVSTGADRITWVTVTGTVTCPGPLPDLTWGDG
jgi:hypothetical protein